jgi:hypothetical protein
MTSIVRKPRQQNDVGNFKTGRKGKRNKERNKRHGRM